MNTQPKGFLIGSLSALQGHFVHFKIILSQMVKSKKLVAMRLIIFVHSISYGKWGFKIFKKKGKMSLSSRKFGHFEANLDSMTSLNVQYRENMASMSPFILFHMIDYIGISLGII